MRRRGGRNWTRIERGTGGGEGEGRAGGATSCVALEREGVDVGESVEGGAEGAGGGGDRLSSLATGVDGTLFESSIFPLFLPLRFHLVFLCCCRCSWTCPIPELDASTSTFFSCVSSQSRTSSSFSSPRSMFTTITICTSSSSDPPSEEVVTWSG